MPVYMDLHIGQDITPEIVALAHQRDLELQDEFNCKCLTYWFDEPRGNAYCLIEAPDKASVYALHKKSHEKLPDEIIEVDRRVIKAFLGRLHDPSVVDYMIDSKIKVFNDPAFRVILMLNIKDEFLLQAELGEKRSEELNSGANKIIRKLIEENQGVASEDKGDEIIATFTSANQALGAALDIQSGLGTEFGELDIRIAIHAGEPVEVGEELFGSTLRFGRFLCHFSEEQQIQVSNTVKKLLENSDEQNLIDGNSISSLSKADEEFLVQLIKVMEKNWQNSSYEIEDCYSALSMSKSQLYRRCMETVGVSPNRILRDYRLYKAKAMLKSKNLNVAQTAFECGFNSPSYFTRCFHKKFGLRPQKFMEMNI